MEAVLDTGFSLVYRDQVLRFLFPLFPEVSTKEGATHVHTLTRLLVTLADSSLTVPLFLSLIPKNTLLSYQLAFDLVEGGARDYLDIVRSELPEGDEARSSKFDDECPLIYATCRKRSLSSTNCEAFSLARSLSRSILSS